MLSKRTGFSALWASGISQLVCPVQSLLLISLLSFPLPLCLLSLFLRPHSFGLLWIDSELRERGRGHDYSQGLDGVRIGDQVLRSVGAF